MTNHENPNPILGQPRLLLEPRLLIVLLLVAVIVVFLIPHVAGLLLMLAYLLALHQIAGLAWRPVFKMLRSLFFFFVLVVAINGFLVDGTPLPTPLGWFSEEGTARGVFFGVRVLVLYQMMFLFLALAPHEAIAKGVAGLVRPASPSVARRLGFYAFLVAGFLPLFIDEIERIRVAQRFRGGGFDRGFVARIRSARLLVIPVIVSAIHRSGQLAIAVELRNIDNTIGRLLVVQRPGTIDLALIGVTLVVLCIALFLG